MTIQFAPAQTDFYKWAHPHLMLEGVTEMYGNFTSRHGKLSNIKGNEEVTFVGLQYFIKDVLIREWNETFFSQPKDEVIAEVKLIARSALGVTDYDTSHLEDLHDLGYMPVSIKALPEGVSVPYGVAPVTFVNTVEGFGWLEGFLETSFSCENFPIQTSATTARAYLKRTIEAFDAAGLPHDLVPFMCHDFSFRGMFGRHAAAMSGFGHLTAFAGTDTIPSILFAKKYYGADLNSELVGASVNATEHSITTSAIAAFMEEDSALPKLEAEVKYVEYLMEQAPTGILSHVSDSFDFWAFVSEGLPMLKEQILSREGKLVIRPDSGDPVKVLTGLRIFDGDSSTIQYTKRQVRSIAKTQEYDAYIYDGVVFEIGAVVDTTPTTYEVKGLIECLGDLFGTTESPTGLKLLHDNIGAIYGDSITLERQDQIISRLEAKGYAGLVVLGIGSFSYQYITRDTHGSAVKSTFAVRDGVEFDVCKDPVTDKKKKSAKGLLRIELEDGKYIQYDQQTREQEQQGELREVFRDGNLLIETTLEKIRENVRNSLK
ncbi:nicotinamide phosphoribosyl transferase [Vibrio phage eugene 12A10]|uniref:nicotinamide phosphoribosyl transferase n=1 Tax=Vibrio phage eugene 12A10 TaxID=573172 RepID=UPI000351E9B8|nr:nicotinamide phosphoribosyl transferase [Vibrio phage eugene 12A10]AGN51601.1 nicotinate phosphoribosyltransferase [Vibrio phage eugene 12A10]